MLQHLSNSISPRMLESPIRLDPIVRQLDEYFTNQRDSFTIPLDWSLFSGLSSNSAQTPRHQDRLRLEPPVMRRSHGSRVHQRQCGPSALRAQPTLSPSSFLVTA